MHLVVYLCMNVGMYVRMYACMRVCSHRELKYVCGHCFCITQLTPMCWQARQKQEAAQAIALAKQQKRKARKALRLQKAAEHGLASELGDVGLEPDISGAFLEATAYVCMLGLLYICAYECIHVYLYVCLHVYVCMYACVHVCAAQMMIYLMMPCRRVLL